MKPLLLLCALLAVSVSDLSAARPEPDAQIAAFFAALGDKDGAAAIDGLYKGTFLDAHKHAQIAALAPQIDTATKVYGKVTRVEVVDKKPFGANFVRIRVITSHAIGAPIFWEFMFFKAKSDWEIHIFQFNDDFERVFSSTRDS